MGENTFWGELCLEGNKTVSKTRGIIWVNATWLARCYNFLFPLGMNKQHSRQQDQVWSNNVSIISRPNKQERLLCMETATKHHNVSRVSCVSAFSFPSVVSILVLFIAWSTLLWIKCWYYVGGKHTQPNLAKVHRLPSQVEGSLLFHPWFNKLKSVNGDLWSSASKS